MSLTITFWVIISTTRSSDNDDTEESLFYVINFEDDEGFAIMGAGTRLPTDIFAITDNGNLDPDEEVDNPGLSIFLDALTSSNLITPAGNKPPAEPKFPEDPDKSGVTWHQIHPTIIVFHKYWDPKF